MPNQPHAWSVDPGAGGILVVARVGEPALWSPSGMAVGDRPGFLGSLSGVLAGGGGDVGLIYGVGSQLLGPFGGGELAGLGQSYAIRDTSFVFSGDASLQYVFGAGGGAGDWQGVTTNDPTKGVFCIPLRPGVRYRFKLSTAVGTFGNGEQYRLNLISKADGSIVSTKTVAFKAANTYQTDDWPVTVPAGSDPLSCLQIQFNRGTSLAGYQFWVDSLRVVEDVPSATDISDAIGAATVELLQNPDAEAGTAYWRVTAGNLLSSLTLFHNTGAQSFQILSPASSTTYRYQQCDRPTDLANPTDGNPIYIPVDPFDEIFMSGFTKASGFALQATIKIGVEEYDANKALIQRSYCVTTAVDTVWLGKSGGIVLQSTTAYIVPIVEIITDGSVWTALYIGFDTLHARRYPAARRCHRYKAADQTLVATVTETLVALDSTLWQVSTMDGTASRVTIPSGPDQPKVGTVTIRGQVEFAGPAAPAGYRQVRIKKNGTTFLAKQRLAAVVTANLETTVQVAVEDHLAAPGDYYELWATHNQGANMTLTHGSDLTFLQVVHRP